MNKIIKNIFYISIFLISLFLIIWIVRTVSSRQVDDVNPYIPCQEGLIKNSESLAVIPFYKNISISENRDWCASIKELNKTLVMHGVYHNYNEFFKDISVEDISK